MSLKLILNKLTSMVLVICMLLSLAAPAVGEEPLTQPTEETVYSDGSTVYADGTVVYADGTIVYADGTTVHADGTTVNADGTTIYPDGTAVYADGRIVYADGTTAYPDGTTAYVDGTVVYANGTIVYADGTTVHADGTTVNADGTTVYPDGSTDAVLEEAPVPLAVPEPVIPDVVIETEGENSEEYTAVVTENPEATGQKTADPAAPTDPAAETQPVTDGEAAGGEAKTATTIPGKEAEQAEEAENAEKAENTEKQDSAEADEPESEEAPEENVEGQTEENPAETTEDTVEDTAEETTEEPAEEATEETTEDAEKDTAEDKPEETTAPVEELPLRTLTASADQMAFRDQFLNPREPVLWSASVWNWLYGSAIEPAYTDDRVTVEISGHFPETVTARAMFIEFADPSAARNDERALMLLDVALLDETGALYVPTEKLHVSVSAASISGAAESGEPFAAYFDDSYDGIGDAGDIKVRLDENIDGSRLSYVPEQNEALRFWEAGGRLVSTGNGTVEFDENRFPFRFVLSAQQEEREEEQTEQQNVVRDVSLSGTLVASDGYTYEVSVSYPANCGIPVGAQLSVEELIVGTDAYWDYINQSAAELGISPADLSLARAFDISLVDPETGVHYQPTQDVQVSITLISTPVNTEEEIEVLHFDDEAGQVQAMDVALNGEAIEFETGSFSVFVVLQRVIEKNLDAGDGYTYHISVDYDNTSGIPDGVELVADELLEGDAFYDAYVTRAAAELGESVENLSFARAFNISLMDPLTGIYYQPNKNVKVSIQILNDHLADYASIDVVHFGNDVEIIDASVNGETVAFTTGGFSVYVIMGSNGESITPQCTYTFWIPNEDVPETYKEYAFTDSQGNTIYNQVITRGDELVVPALTSTEDAVFAGWYEGIRTGGTLTLNPEPYDFNNITITQNSAVDLYAVYRRYAAVIFHDQYDSESGTFPIAFSRRAELVTEGNEPSATVKISDVSTTYTGSGDAQMAFFGWSEKPITNPGAATDDEGNDVSAVTADSDGCITITETKHLYPIYKKTYWLHYYTAQSGLSAAYVPPEQHFEGEPVGESLPTTSRDGYHFMGWFTGTLETSEGVETVNYGRQVTDKNGDLVTVVDDGGVYVSGGQLYLHQDATLFAKWEATYHIVYWKQVTTETPETAESEKHYEYAETVTKTADIQNWGDTVVIAAEDRKIDRYNGYTLNNSRSDISAVINNTKELTVFNLYYDLTEAYSASGESQTLTFKDSVTGSEEAVYMPEAKDIEYNTPLKEYKPDTDPVSGRTSGTGKKIYNFSGWYMDQDCTIPVDWNVITMPDHNLTVYAGWEPIRFTVDIDPNYGALYTEDGATGTGATYFNSTYDAEPIGEYTHVTRNYAESSSGTWYYVNHDRAYGGDRHTYYTQDPGLATEETIFEFAPGTYTYVGWYEVYLDEAGNEIGEASLPYDFSQHVDHNTKLRLHWKKTGTYYLAYDAGEGTLEDGTTTVVLPDGYADYAEVTLNHAAKAPAGFTFVGWRLHNSESSTIYTPGQVFTLHADDAMRFSGKDVVWLDAVYVKVGTASIIYDANGGTIAESGVDLGQVPGNTADEWNPASGTIDEGRTTAVVSGLTNNTRFKLSNGRGFTAPDGSDATFLGWSDKAVCDDSAVFYSKDSGDKYAVNTDEPITLYAVWGVQVNYALTSSDADWGPVWNTSVYTLDPNTNIYSQAVNRGNAISEPENIPVYNGSDGRLFRYWATRTETGSDENPYVYEEYDFSQPVTGVLNLYSYWSEPNTIKVHAVDASEETLTEKTSADDWSIQDVTVSVTRQELTASAGFVTAPENYEFAFAAVADANLDSLNSISSADAVTAVIYGASEKKVLVQYAGESEYRDLGDGKALYFVYYQKKELPIGYKYLDTDGNLRDAAVDVAAPMNTEDTLLGTYDMAVHILLPLDWASQNYTGYAFAVGNSNPTTANDLSILTPVSTSDESRPTLRVRNTWRGFQYTSETGDDAEWTSCGYDPQLYVIYYMQQPTVVVFSEKTVGTSAVIYTRFTFNYVVLETTTVTESKEGAEDQVTTTVREVYNTASGEACQLKTGEEHSIVLFFNETQDVNTETGVTTAVVTEQSVTITQVENSEFTTTVEGDDITEPETFSYTYTADGSDDTKNVTFTNTHKSLSVEVHVAVVEGDGTAGSIIQRDDTYRSAEQTAYSFDLALGESKTLLTELPESTVFTGDTNTYAFGAAVLGTGTEGNAVTVTEMGAAAVSYAKQNDNIYELVIEDKDGNIIGELGSNQLYYLFYPMPKIKYVKEASDGTLTDITGCVEDPVTGDIIASELITYSHEQLTMNGDRTVAQNQSVEIPTEGLVISQNGNSFRMPPVLDDGIYERYLSYVKIGVGNGNAAGISELDVSTSRTMRLKIQDNSLQYSFDGTEWKNLPISGAPAIYAIYTERGYDLQISKTVDMSQSGENAIFSGSSFAVTITSTAITKEIYDAEGAESATISAAPASDTAPGTISFSVEDGTRIRIKGLGQGDYTVQESGNENYTLTAKSGPIVGGSTSAMEVTDNTTVSLALDAEKKIDLTNSPKAICRIGDNYFYTLQSMVDYVSEEIATKTAEAEMLTDYVVPAEDAIEIPNGFNITLTTAERVGHVAVLTRTSALSDTPLFTNNGTLAITNVMLEGGSIAATAPMIQSAGNLTIGSGAAIQNVNNTSSGDSAAYGGAISATAGDITVSGTIENCSSEKGGAIYHSGNGTISLRDSTIQDNTATGGDGGAVYLNSGTIELSGTSKLTGNNAEYGSGGAIYAGNALIKLDQGAGITNNTAKEGGAIYAETGTITVSETEGAVVKPAITGNTATGGNGGAICVSVGSVTVSGGTVSNNSAGTGDGGAIWTNTASVSISDTAEVRSNQAANGGAVYSTSGAVTVSGGSVSSNTALTGNGGAIHADSGNVTVSGGSMSENKSTAGSGGAIYSDKGNVVLSGEGTSISANKAGTNGGGVCAAGGTITASGSVALENNEAGQNGGAIYVYSGSSTLTAVTAAGNKAANGAAVFADTGRITLSGGSYTGNNASNGGAVGVGSTNARLVFTGNVQIRDNTLGSGDDAPKSNVYLDQDDDAVINIDTLGTGATIGIFVPDDLVEKRSVPGARFAVYTSNTNVNKITNDRFPALTVQSDTAAKKLYWGNAIKVEVRYLASYSGGFPPSVAGTSKYTNDGYYPEFNDGAISELAAELNTKYNLNLTATAVYGNAFREGATEFADYVTKLTWNTTESKWQLTKRDGGKVNLEDKKIIIFYAEPAYIAIENNTNMSLSISDMKVNNTSVINSNTVAGYGMVFAKNGAIRTALLPITADDLTLIAGSSVNLLIPGGQNMAYTLDGNFETTEAGSVKLRRGPESSLIEEQANYDESGVFTQLTGNTLSGSGTYQIIFGDDKVICKVVDAEGTEHPYSKISDAISGIVATTGANPPYTLKTAKTATIEMVTDYLLPASDAVQIPKGYNITITTAEKEVGEYPYTGEGDRAIISRDSENTSSMITSETGDVNSKLTLKKLIIDGKSVRGTSAGGAVSLKFFEVELDTVDFYNVYASQGGALYVDDWNNNARGKANSKLTANNCLFKNCNCTNSGNRYGGGAIHFFGDTLELGTCQFIDCYGLDQAGAVFHRVDNSRSGSWTTINGCTFTNCTAKAAGGLELDSMFIEVTGCTFEHCASTERNGGGFNIYVANVQNPDFTCTAKIAGCTFNDCQNTGVVNDNAGHGGGFRSNSLETTVTDCTFTNTSTSRYGGGVCFSNTNATIAEVYGCTFDRCTSSRQGGGIFSRSKSLIIGDYIYREGETPQDTSIGDYIRDDEGNIIGRRTEVKNCWSTNEGGGVYQTSAANPSSLNISNTTITGNEAITSGKQGGGVYTNAREVEIKDSVITDNHCKSQGGGVYANSYTSLTIIDSNISGNTATGDGGGVYFFYKDQNNGLTIKGSTIDGNTSGGNGGGLYTMAKTVTIGASTTKFDSSGKPMPSSVSNNEAKNGGGIYQDRNVEGSALVISDTDIKRNNANETGNNAVGGGGVYANVWTMTLTDSEVSGNTALKHGGGIYKNGADNNRYLIVDNSEVKGNTAGNQGGGIFDLSQLWLKNNAEISGNRLTTNKAADCAGVYLDNNRTLYVGSQDGDEVFKDTIYVRNNTTADGTLSDLRLWEANGENKNTSVYVYCHLQGEIYVVNANKAGTWFGSSEIESPHGFSDDEKAVFKADASTLHGILDQTDPDHKKIIWAGPPICKITDNEGNLLYFKTSAGSEVLIPARFDRLDNGTNNASNAGAFSILKNTRENLRLFYKDGTPAVPSDGEAVFCVKMLVDSYTAENYVHMNKDNREWMTIRLMTEENTDPTEEDPYPYRGTAGTRCTIYRGRSIPGGKSMFTANVSLKVENIILDGNNIEASANGVLISNHESQHALIELGEKSVLQNAKTSANGGAIWLDYGKMNLSGGTIRNCSAAGSGGAIYMASQYKTTGGPERGIMTFKAGTITGCTADKGGGVYLGNNGLFNMTGATVSNCSAKQGGGLFVDNTDTKASFNMSGGDIINNKATVKGGGVAFGNSVNIRLNFSAKVNISGNTCDASVAPGKACNVELDQSSKAIINTNNGGLYSGSYIGVYVPGNETENPYKEYGGERDNFGTFANNSDTSTFYCFVNDRNGLKGGIIENPNPNTIYWIKIFALQVTKKVEAGESTTVDSEEKFLFKVNIRGKADVVGQLNAEDIDSSTGEYGEMVFSSNSIDTTTAVFALKDGESVTSVNLSEGLVYEVIEYMTEDQITRYAAMPMNGYNADDEKLKVDGTTYTVRKVNTYSSTVGENKSRTDVDPYTSALTFTNLIPVCKITDMHGNLLYRKYYWDKITNNPNEPNKGDQNAYQDGPGVEEKDRPFYYAPAVYTELSGDDGAFKAVEGTLYTSNGSYPSSYDVSEGVKIQMLISEYSLKGSITEKTSKVTLTTASGSDSLFPKRDSGNTATIRRAYTGDSMFSVNNGGDLTLATIILDGAKGSFSANANGGIAYVANGGRLTIVDGATLQKSKTAAGYNGGAAYVENGGTVTMTGGTVNLNESVDEGAGVYLSEGSTLYLSGSPDFGGTGLNISGNIRTDTGNIKDESYTAMANGGKGYSMPRQDIYIAGYSGPDGDTTAASLVVNGEIKSDNGTIWVWAEQSPHHKALEQFAKKYTAVTESSLKAFRNARPDVQMIGDDIIETGAGRLGTYLYGMTKSDDTTGQNVYWYGLSGSRRVILRKVQEGSYSPIDNLTFGIYTSAGCDTPAKDKDGTTLSPLQSYPSGVFYSGELYFGTYYIKESGIEGQFFVLKVDDTGYYWCNKDGKPLNKDGSIASEPVPTNELKLVPAA